MFALVFCFLLLYVILLYFLSFHLCHLVSGLVREEERVALGGEGPGLGSQGTQPLSFPCLCCVHFRTQPSWRGTHTLTGSRGPGVGDRSSL